MARSRDSIEMRLKLARAREFQRGVDKSARSVDNLGDQAAQAARKMGRLNAASSKSRVSLGPFSTSLRGAALAVGGFMLAAQSAIPWTVGLTEAVATMGGGVAAAGGVLGTTFVQGLAVAASGASDLTEALGGNAEALKRLPPEAQNVFYTLSKAQDQLKLNANQGLFPGLEDGVNSAVQNLPVLNKIFAETGKTLGGIARDAGSMLGSKEWGSDIADIGATNTKIMDNLGHAGLNLATAAKDIIHEAGPLTEWLSRMALRGSELTAEWTNNARATGKLSEFFRTAKTDLRILGSMTGHGTRGIINLFGHNDVNGTDTLRNLDALLARFERWTNAIKGKPLSAALQTEMEDAIAGIADFIGAHIGEAGATAAAAFWKSFMSADVGGKAILATWFGAKFGPAILKRIRDLSFLGRGGLPGKSGGLLSQGPTGSMTNPFFVVNLNEGGKAGIPGKGGEGLASKGGKLALLARLGLPAAAIYAIAGGKVPFAGRLYKDPKNPRDMNADELTKKIDARKHVIERSRRQGATPDVLRAQETGLRRLERQRDQVAWRGARNVGSGYTPGENLTVENHVTITLPDGPAYKSTSRTVTKRSARRRVRASGPGESVILRRAG